MTGERSLDASLHGGVGTSTRRANKSSAQLLLRSDGFPGTLVAAWCPCHEQDDKARMAKPAPRVGPRPATARSPDKRMNMTMAVIRPTFTPRRGRPPTSRSRSPEGMAIPAAAPDGTRASEATPRQERASPSASAPRLRQPGQGRRRLPATSAKATSVSGARAGATIIEPMRIAIEFQSNPRQVGGLRVGRRAKMFAPLDPKCPAAQRGSPRIGRRSP